MTISAWRARTRASYCKAFKAEETAPLERSNCRACLPNQKTRVNMNQREGETNGACRCRHRARPDDVLAHYGSVRRFQKIMKAGIEEALASGVQERYCLSGALSWSGRITYPIRHALMLR